jgi:hypothetical protein
MVRTDVGRCPACGLGVSVGIVELEGDDPSGATRIERFTCGHRITGPSNVEVSEAAALRRLMSRTVGKLRARSARGIFRIPEALSMRIRDELGRVKR